MKRFHFHLYEPQSVTLDDAGVERRDLEAARHDAIIAARSLMAADIMDGRLMLSARIEVVDDGGQVVLSLPFRDCVEVEDRETEH